MQVLEFRHAKGRRVEPRSGWTFLSNHSHALIALAKDPDMRIRDLAAEIGITERAVAQILTDLQSVGVLKRRRLGRRNVYEINRNVHLRHKVEAHRTVGDILHLAEPAPSKKRRNAESGVRL